MNNVIEFNNVSKTYENFQMNNVNFSVPQGLITGFIGPNGSGKTTSIKMLLNSVYRDGGAITLLGKEPIECNHENIGYVLDEGFLVEDWKVGELNNLMRTFYSNWDEALFKSYLKRFKLDESYTVKQLSRGMTVKLYISIALSHNAKLLVLDEPTSGLDPSAREEITEILQDFIENPNNSVFFSTHITSDLEAIADNIVFILNGKIMYEGDKETLLETYQIVKGGLDDLNMLNKSDLIGIKKQSTHFEALCLSTYTSQLDLVYESVTLDDLIKFYNREENNEKNY